MSDDVRLRKLDPLLRLTASSADHEVLGDLFKFEKNSSILPTDLTDLPGGLQAHTSRLSVQAAGDFLSTDLVPVLIQTTGSHSASEQLSGLGVQGEYVSPTAIAAHIPRSHLKDVADLQT